MKEVRLYTITTLLLSILSFTSSAKRAQVKLNPKDVFIYEWRFKQAASFTKPSRGFCVIRYSLQIDSVSHEKIAFSARVLSHVNELENLPFEFSYDYGFPSLSRIYQEEKLTDIIDETLYNIPFRFELDRKQNTIDLVNKDEIISRSREILKSRHYASQTIGNVETMLQYDILNNKTTFFLQPFRYIRTNPDIRDTLTENKTKALVHNPGNGMLEINGVPDKNLTCFNSRIDLRHGLIISSVKRMRTDKKNFISSWEPWIKQTEPEEKLLLIEQTNNRRNKNIVCGHIENPVGSLVKLYTQTRPFGTEPDTKSTELDNTGNFRFEFTLAERGLIFLENPNNNHFYRSVPVILYSAPGDSIRVNLSLTNKDYYISSFDPINLEDKVSDKNTVPQTITFSGDRAKEAQVLHRFQNLNERPGMSGIDCSVYLKALAELNTLLKPLTDDQSYAGSALYLQKELQAYLYSNLFNVRENNSMFSWDGNICKPTVTEGMINLIYSQLDTVNIHRIYNDYGIFSRSLTKNYVDYKYFRLNISKNKTLMQSRLDPEESLQFCKMVLYGPAMYREAANQLYTALLNPPVGLTVDGRWQSKIDEMFALMLERCNDEAFTRSIRGIVENHSKWKEIKHIPDNYFLNLKREKISLRTFIPKRTTIIYASGNWSNGRHEMGEAAKIHPEINFVHIDEGENFEYWKEWNSQANSAANQLYLPGDSTKLRDIFLNNINKYIIFDRSGKRIDIKTEIENAIQVAEDSRRQYFKDVSKSVLAGIIVFLGVLLFILLAGFLFYKIRMNRKIKKHRMENRLRELQLAALRSQMNPHFLFNSLNSVQNLIRQDKSREAHLYLSDFAGLIRKVLKNSDKEEVTLAEEIDTLQKYLSLEKLRFEFDYKIEVDDAIDQDLFMLPALILQPLAENALLHGLQHKKGEKKLWVRITKTGNEIHIIIEDNGIGIDASKKLRTNSNGIGIRINEERIRMMQEKYGGYYSFKIIDLTAQGQEGTRVEIVIPEEQ